MNLLPAILPLAFVGAAGTALALGLICFVIGVHQDDRAKLGPVPGGLCSRLARRAAGLHVISSFDKD